MKSDIEYHDKDGNILILDGIKMRTRDMADWIARRKSIVSEV